MQENEFPGQPGLQTYFENIDRKIKYFGSYRQGGAEEKKMLIRKREALFRIATEMNHNDLMILFYIRSIDPLGVPRMLRMLREVYQAECKFKNELYNTDEYKDPMVF